MRSKVRGTQPSLKFPSNIFSLPSPFTFLFFFGVILHGNAPEHLLHLLRLHSHQSFLSASFERARRGCDLQERRLGGSSSWLPSPTSPVVQWPTDLWLGVAAAAAPLPLLHCPHPLSSRLATISPLPNTASSLLILYCPHFLHATPYITPLLSFSPHVFNRLLESQHKNHQWCMFPFLLISLFATAIASSPRVFRLSYRSVRAPQRRAVAPAGVGGRWWCRLNPKYQL